MLPSGSSPPTGTEGLRRRVDASRRRNDATADTTTDVSLPPMTDKEKEKIHHAILKKEERKGALFFFFVILFALGIPSYIIYINTPFFTFQNLKCRVTDRFIAADRYAVASEAAYEAFFHKPPLFGSEEYHRVMLWGTYDPSKIFAMTTAPGALTRNGKLSTPSTEENGNARHRLPLTVGIAWYDDAGLFPLRHTTALLHNRVMSLKSQKKGSDEDTLRMEWTVHDGHHYGRLTVRDYPLHLEMEIEFLKSPGGDGWHARIHGKLEPPSSVKKENTDVHVVVYLMNEDEEVPVDVASPPASSTLLLGSGFYHPTLRTEMWNHRGEQEAVALHIEDDHSPFATVQPWRIYQLRTKNPGLEDASAQFAFRTTDTFGGRLRERMQTEGKTRQGLTMSASDIYASPPLNLRSLACQDADVFCVLESGDLSTFRTAPMTADDDAVHNMVVLKRQYNADFRLELSLTSEVKTGGNHEAHADSTSSATPSPHFTGLSVCQATNAFRRRQKKILEHHFQILKHWGKDVGDGRGSSLYQRVGSTTLSELLGSLSYAHGAYQVSSSTASSLVSFSPAYTFSFLGSRTDEPFGRMDVSGYQLVFLVRYNKELMKSMLHSWLVGAQDPKTGFIPVRTGFNAYIRSLMPAEYRWEDSSHGAPPTLLVGLQELLREMRRKKARVLARRQSNARSRRKERNSDAYLDQEQRADLHYLREILPALKQWRHWWHTTQCGGVTDELARSCDHALIHEDGDAGETPKAHHQTGGYRRLEDWPVHPTGDPRDQLAYRWRGRQGTSLSPSGMEDYPRPTCSGHEHRELHVDLFSWIAYLSQLVSVIEVEFLGLEESVQVNWEAHLERLHWDDANQRYSDRIGCPSASPLDAPPFSTFVGFANVYPVALGIPRLHIQHIFKTMDLVYRNLSDTRHGVQSLAYSSVRQMRENKIPHHNLFTGTIWPHQNFLYSYALKSVYGNPDASYTLGKHGARQKVEVEEGDYASGDEADRKEVEGLQRTAMKEYNRLRKENLPALIQVTRWWECYNPVNGDGLAGKTYIGSRALLLGLLYDYE